MKGVEKSTNYFVYFLNPIAQGLKTTNYVVCLLKSITQGSLY